MHWIKGNICLLQPIGGVPAAPYDTLRGGGTPLAYGLAVIFGLRQQLRSCLPHDLGQGLKQPKLPEVLSMLAAVIYKCMRSSSRALLQQQDLQPPQPAAYRLAW
jgi:hypothetical protein